MVSCQVEYTSPALPRGSKAGTDTEAISRVQGAISIDLPAEAASLLRLLLAADLFPNGGIYTGAWAQLAIRRYLCQWLPLLLSLEDPAEREVLIPPPDVALVWLLHRTADIHMYVEDCTTLSFCDYPEREPELLNVGPEQALAFSDGTGPLGMLAFAAWTAGPEGLTEEHGEFGGSSTRSANWRSGPQQPYWPPQLPKSSSGGSAQPGGWVLPMPVAEWEEDVRGRLLGLLPQAAWLLGRLVQGRFTGFREDMEQAMERYCRFLLLAQRHQSELLLFPPDVLLMWWAHKAHSGAYLADMDVLMGCPFDPILPSLDDPVLIRRTAQLYEDEFGLPYDMPCTMRSGGAPSMQSAAASISGSGLHTAGGGRSTPATFAASTSAGIADLASRLAPLLRFFGNPTEEAGAAGFRPLFTSSSSVISLASGKHPTAAAVSAAAAGGHVGAVSVFTESRSSPGGGPAPLLQPLKRRQEKDVRAAHSHKPRLGKPVRKLLATLALARSLRRCSCGGSQPTPRGEEDADVDDRTSALSGRAGAVPDGRGANATAVLAASVGDRLAAGHGRMPQVAGHATWDQPQRPAYCNASASPHEDVTVPAGPVGAGDTGLGLQGSNGGYSGMGGGGAGGLAAEPQVVPLCSEMLALFNQTTGFSSMAGGRYRVSALGMVMTQGSLVAGSSGAMGAMRVRRGGGELRYLVWLLERALQEDWVVEGGSTTETASVAVAGRVRAAGKALGWLFRRRTSSPGDRGTAAAAAEEPSSPTCHGAGQRTKALARAATQLVAGFSAFEGLPMRSDHPFWLSSCPGAAAMAMHAEVEGAAAAHRGLARSSLAAGTAGLLGLQPQPSGVLAAVLSSGAWEVALAKEVKARASLRSKAGKA